jgi:hypothetical protein
MNSKRKRTTNNLRIILTNVGYTCNKFEIQIRFR